MMTVTRRELALSAFAIGLLSTVPAFAGADEDAIAKSLEAFRAAQAAGNPEVIASICALVASGFSVKIIGPRPPSTP